MGASIAIPLGRRKIAQTAAGIAAVGAGAVGFPIVGVPLALGIGMYAAIKLSKPNQILRGRTLSPRQQHRAAVIMGGVMLGIAVFFSGTLLALDIANTLEQRLHDALTTAHRRGRLMVGQVLDECERSACARATVIKLATPGTLGIVKLSGFTLHENTIYHWRNMAGQSESHVAQ
jgi:hypothetical protein